MTIGMLLEPNPDPNPNPNPNPIPNPNPKPKPKPNPNQVQFADRTSSVKTVSMETSFGSKKRADAAGTTLQQARR